MCFAFGAPKIQERFATLTFESVHRDLRTVGGRGPVSRDLNSGVGLYYGGEGANYIREATVNPKKPKP